MSLNHLSSSNRTSICTSNKRLVLPGYINDIINAHEKLKENRHALNHRLQNTPPRILVITLCLFSFFPNNPFTVAR